MTQILTLDAFLDALSAHGRAQPLVFTQGGAAISGGYHVTEFKRARIESIDCGGRRAAFEEAAMQLLDGVGGGRMSVEKFVAIARRSRDAIQGLGGAELRVEFGAGNASKTLYRLGVPVAGAEGVEVPLLDDAAVCKPAAERGTGCCGPSAAAPAAPEAPAAPIAHAAQSDTAAAVATAGRCC